MAQVGALESGAFPLSKNVLVTAAVRAGAGKWATHTFKVRHVSPHIGVERVHHHLAVGRPRDLDAAVHQARRRLRAPPGVVVADVPGLRQEVGEHAAVELGLAEGAALQELAAAAVEGAVQQGEEGEGVAVEDAPRVVVERAEDGDALEETVGAGHAAGVECEDRSDAGRREDEDGARQDYVRGRPDIWPLCFGARAGDPRRPAESIGPWTILTVETAMRFRQLGRGRVWETSDRREGFSVARKKACACKITRFGAKFHRHFGMWGQGLPRLFTFGDCRTPSACSLRFWFFTACGFRVILTRSWLRRCYAV